MALHIGEPVGDFTFEQRDGTLLRLSELKPRAVLLVFLRHLA